MKEISRATDPSFWSHWQQSPVVLDLSRRRRFRPALAEHFRDLLGIADDPKVLDVGCGPGTLTRFIAQHLAVRGSVWGIDRDAMSLEYGRQAAAREGVGNVHFQIADGYELPFDDGFFDAVTSYTVIEHIPDTERFLREQIRVCARGGTVSVMGIASTWRDPYDAMPTDGRMAALQRKLQSICAAVEHRNGVRSGIRVSGVGPWLERCGLRAVRVDGFWHPLCRRDQRYRDQWQEIAEREFIAPFAEFSRFLVEGHPDLLGPDTMTVEELRELTELSAAWQRKRLIENQDADDAWSLSDGPSLIVSGRRP